MNAPVTPPERNAESFEKTGLGKGVVGGGAAVVVRTRSPRRPRLINCAPRARRSARFGEERAPRTRQRRPAQREPIGRAPAARVARGHGASREEPKQRQEKRVKGPAPAAQLQQARLQQVR